MRRTQEQAPSENMHELVVSGFGDEWKRLPQDRLSDSERLQIFNDYFRIFPWTALPTGGGVGADIGCGSGRWATVAAPKVELLHIVDASSEALEVAKSNSILVNHRLRR